MGVTDLVGYLFSPPEPPTIPDLGLGARVTGIQGGLQTLVAKAVEGAFFLGVQDGLVVGLCLGLAVGLLLGLGARRPPYA